jgi:hypothetical protein
MINNKVKQNSTNKTLCALISAAIFSLMTIASAAESVLEIEILTRSNDPLQQFTVPEHFYLQGATKNQSHISIIDKFGTSLPYRVSKTPKKTQHQKRSVKIYALKETKDLQKQTDNISLKYDSRNRLTEVNRNNGSIVEDRIKSSGAIKGYLLDLGKNFPRENSQLTFELSTVTDTNFLKINIDQSSNLKNWRRVSYGEVIAQLVDQGIVVQHNNISLKNSRSRYIRLTILDKNPQFRIFSATQSFDRLSSEKFIWTSFKEMSFDKKEQAYFLEISPILTYKRFQIQMPSPPSIILGSLSQRLNNKTQWSGATDVDFININNDNNRILENESPLWTRNRDRLKFSINYSSPKISQAPLLVKLAYEPQKVTFFANGNWPYKIQLSHQGSNNKDNKKLFNLINRQTNGAVGMASLGHSRMVEMDYDENESKLDWKKIGLWLILISGVVLMAWMAKQLLKKID